MPLFVFLPTDAVMWLITAVLIASFIYVRRSPRTREKWSRVFSRPIPQASCVILLVFFALGLADSIHFRPQLASASGESTVYSASTESLLDSSVGNWIAGRERSYSSPFAITEFDKTSALVDGKPVRIFAHLKGITPEAKTATDRNRDAALRTLAALSNWVLVSRSPGRSGPRASDGQSGAAEGSPRPLPASSSPPSFFSSSGVPITRSARIKPGTTFSIRR